MSHTKPLSVSLEPAPQAGEAVSLLSQAQTLTITDQVSHAACRTFLKGAKTLKRAIEDHYAAIKEPLNKARTAILAMEKTHLAPVLQAIALAEKADLDYVHKRQRIEQQMADRRREKAEAKAEPGAVVVVPPVETKIATVAGTSVRTYYSCGSVDLRALVQLAAKDDRYMAALMPNLVFLNGEARSLRDLFEQSYPCCTVRKSEGVVG